MPVEYFDCDQNDDTWRKLRAGIPTASAFKAVLAKGEDGKTRRSYLNKLAAEVVLNAPLDGYRNAAMDRGHEQEPKARNTYSLLTDTEPKQVGFARNGRKGCSPDSLIGTDGILEIKTQEPDLLVDTIRLDKFPAAHVAQCQGALWVCEREWVDIAVYSPGMPLFVRRAHRDETYIATLAREVDRFLADLDAMVEMVRRYGEAA